MHSKCHPIYVDKLMSYIMIESGGDCQQGGYPYKPTSGFQWTPKHSWTSDRPQKQALENRPVNFRRGVMVIS